MESFSVLMSSCEDEDDDDDEDKDDDDDIELSLERREYLTEDEDEVDDESNIQSTNVDSPSKSLVIELWSCCHSSIVLHFEVTSSVWMVEDVLCGCCHMCFFIYKNTIEFFHPKNKHFLKKTVHTGHIFIRKYSYLKIKFYLCIRKIILPLV